MEAPVAMNPGMRGGMPGGFRGMRGRGGFIRGRGRGAPYVADARQCLLSDRPFLNRLNISLHSPIGSYTGSIASTTQRPYWSSQSQCEPI